jgi:hypothetical protein
MPWDAEVKRTFVRYDLNAGIKQTCIGEKAVVFAAVNQRISFFRDMTLLLEHFYSWR